MADIALSYRPDASVAPELFAGVNAAMRAISAQNAFLIQDMMRDVIRRGTGRRALQLGRRDLSGKTGTSNDRRDAKWKTSNSPPTISIATANSPWVVRRMSQAFPGGASRDDSR